MQIWSVDAGAVGGRKYGILTLARRAECKYGILTLSRRAGGRAQIWYFDAVATGGRARIWYSDAGAAGGREYGLLAWRAGANMVLQCYGISGREDGVMALAGAKMVLWRWRTQTKVFCHGVKVFCHGIG